MKTPNRLDAPFLFQAAWSRDFFDLGCLRAVQLGHGAQLSGRLAAGGHLRAGAPHLRSRVGRRHTAATQALQADPACLGRCLSWTCARRSTQGNLLVHHGYRRRSRTSSFSTQTPHTANQCRYGLQVGRSDTPKFGQTDRGLKSSMLWWLMAIHDGPPAHVRATGPRSALLKRDGHRSWPAYQWCAVRPHSPR